MIDRQRSAILRGNERIKFISGEAKDGSMNGVAPYAPAIVGVAVSVLAILGARYTRRQMDRERRKP